MLFFGMPTSGSIWPAAFALALLCSTQVDTRGISSKSPGSDTNAAAVEATGWSNGNGEPTPAGSVTMRAEGINLQQVCTSFYQEDFDEANDICEDFVAANNCPTGTLDDYRNNWYRCCTNC